MHITHIQAEGLKGKSFAYQLTPLVLVAGPNFAGKTAIADAIRLALKGKLPELGGRPSDILDIAPSGRVTVRATVNCDTLGFGDIIRSFEKGRPATEGGTAIDGGALDGMDSLPLLDPDEYFGLSAAGQVNYVFSRIPLPEDCTPAGVLARLRKIDVPGDSTEEIESARAGIVGLVENTLKEQGINEALNELTRDKGILKNAFATWNKAAKESIGAVRVLTELKNQEGECSAETIAMIDQEIAVANEKLAEANAAWGAVTERFRRANASRTRKEEVEAWLAKPVEDYDQQIAAAVVDFNTAAAYGAECAKNITGTHEAMVAKSAAQLANANAQQQAKAAKAKLEEIQKSITDLDSAPCCPFCQSKGKGWKAKLRKSLEASLEEATSNGHAAAAKAGETEQEEARAFAHYVRVREANTALVAANLASHEAEQRLDALKMRSARYLAVREQLTAELVTLTENDFPADKDFEGASSRQADCTQALAALQEKRATALKLQQDIQRAAEAEAEHRKADAYCQVIKAIGSNLNDLKGGIIERVFGKLLETANGLFVSVLRSPIAYHDGSIGRWEGGTFISNKGAFSGTERTLIFIAIAAALSTTAPLRLVILDELARLTPSKQVQVMMAVQKAVAEGVLDQVILILPSDLQATDRVGWTTINLTPA